jgi:hypothetical protein
MLILKPGKANYAEAKAYRPINLVSLMLKAIEKLVDRHIRDEILRFHPLHGNQFACQPSKSTKSALGNVVTHGEYRESSGTQGSSTWSFSRY